MRTHGGFRSFGSEVQILDGMQKVNLIIGQNNVGKSNVAVGLVYRGKLDAPAPDSVAEHDQVSEVYHVIDGSGTVRIVKRSGSTSATSSHAIGQDTRASGVGRTE